MKLMKNLYFCLFLFVNWCFSQTSVNSAGGHINSVSGSISYSVGEVAYKSFSSAQGTVLEGIQFPYEIITLSSDEFPSNNKFSVFPNPVNLEYVSIHVEGNWSSNLSCTVYDNQGKLLYENKIIGFADKVPLHLPTQGFYLLKILEGNRNVKTFKIIKL